MSQYDVVVIGAGPGGYVAAIRASQLGLKAAVVEKEFMGGVCLNIGCVPSKSLLRNAEIAHTLRERGREFGFSFENLELDYSSAVKRSRRVSNRLTKGVEFLMKKNEIDIHRGFGKLLSKDTVLVTAEDGSKTELNAKNIIIATGASSFIIPGIEIDGEKVVTYREAILQENLPESVVIIGGGAIGLEFATVWNSYGVPVTIVEMLDHLAPNEDEEISLGLEKAFKKRGIKIMTECRVTSVEKDGDIVKVNVESGEETQTLEAGQVLLAASFVPNSKGLELEELGVSLDKTKESWTQAIEADGITWPQVSELSFWDCSARDIYVFNSIPHNMLIDKDGLAWKDKPKEQFFLGRTINQKGAKWMLFDNEHSVFISEVVDFKVSDFNVWGWSHVVSPELFIDINIAPGETKSWHRSYIVDIKK